MSLHPTSFQSKIIDYESSCVVVAVPGSGKTFTISEKIKKIIPLLPDYKGVVAISFTRKASNELKNRCLAHGLDKKSSFFGTIDSFFLQEIIFPFGRHIWSDPTQEFDVIKANEQEAQSIEINLSFIDSVKKLEEKDVISFFKKNYCQGKIFLELLGPLAAFILTNSVACRRYLRAKYTHIFIDEYQDCGYWQHQIFIKLVELKLFGTAVGDIDQSIFKFAQRDSKYLFELMHQNPVFKIFRLPDNHRCHPSIVNYAYRHLQEHSELCEVDRINMFHKHINGSEIEIAKWISQKLPLIAKHFEIGKMSEFAILVKSRRTGNLIAKNIGIPCKPIIDDSLTADLSHWGTLFRKILHWLFDNNATKFELLEQYLDLRYQKKLIKEVFENLRFLENIKTQDETKLECNCDIFIEIANQLVPNRKNEKAIHRLEQVLSHKHELDSYKPPKDNEIIISTLHKSKGLEFELVFHLDLYEFIMPQFNGDFDQDANLHYVGITRAKKACILCSSTQRHNSKMHIVDAKLSPFLLRHDLSKLRRTLNKN